MPFTLTPCYLSLLASFTPFPTSLSPRYPVIWPSYRRAAAWPSLQERLPKELEPVLRDLVALAHPMDKTLERWFDLACRESLTNNCLSSTEQLRTKAEFVQVLASVPPAPKPKSRSKAGRDGGV